MRTSTRSVLLLGCAAALAAGCSGSHAKRPVGKLPPRARVVFASDQPLAFGQLSSTNQTGRVLASLGFDPRRDGFSFQNYGFIAGAELDPHVMREMFGDRVCATAPSDSCTLTPEAQQWAESAADQMIGGHCFGFALTSLRFFKHLLNPADFGGSTVFSLPFTPALQSEIAYAAVTQLLPPMQNAENALTFTPTEMVNFLRNALAKHGGDVYGLGMQDQNNPQEGHEVTPIAIEHLGGSRYGIAIYDNNKPGTTQLISIDEATNTWSYDVAINPNVPDSLWSGQGTFNEMELAPVSVAFERQPCPFCGTPSTAGMDAISLSGDPVHHGHLLITASGGGRLGYLNGRFVDTIVGAVVIRPKLNEVWKARPEPIYYVPARYRLSITLNGTGATGDDVATIHVTGPGFGMTLANLRPRTDSRDRIVLAPGASTVSINSRGDAPGRAPTITVARGGGRTGSQLTAAPSHLPPGATLSVSLAGGRPRFRSLGPSHVGKVALTVTRVGPTGTSSSRGTASPTSGDTGGSASKGRS